MNFRNGTVETLSNIGRRVCGKWLALTDVHHTALLTDILTTKTASFQVQEPSSKKKKINFKQNHAGVLRAD
jgi:hypothetical protein